MVSSLWPQPTRLLSPWDSPGKNIGMGCHGLLLQGIFPTQGLNPHPLNCRQVLYLLSQQALYKWINPIQICSVCLLYSIVIMGVIHAVACRRPFILTARWYSTGWFYDFIIIYFSILMWMDIWIVSEDNCWAITNCDVLSISFGEHKCIGQVHFLRFFFFFFWCGQFLKSYWIC